MQKLLRFQIHKPIDLDFVHFLLLVSKELYRLLLGSHLQYLNLNSSVSELEVILTSNDETSSAISFIDVAVTILKFGRNHSFGCLLATDPIMSEVV